MGRKLKLLVKGQLVTSWNNVQFLMATIAV